MITKEPGPEHKESCSDVRQWLDKIEEAVERVKRKGKMCLVQ